MMRNWKLIAGLVIGAAVSAAVSAQQSSKKLTAEDYVEIQQMYTRYHWGADSRDGKLWASVFTPDGAFITGSSRIVGREKLAEFPITITGPASPTSAVH